MTSPHPTTWHGQSLFGSRLHVYVEGMSGTQADLPSGLVRKSPTRVALVIGSRWASAVWLSWNPRLLKEQDYVPMASGLFEEQGATTGKIRVEQLRYQQPVLAFRMNPSAQSLASYWARSSGVRVACMVPLLSAVARRYQALIQRDDLLVVLEPSRISALCRATDAPLSFSRECKDPLAGIDEVVARWRLQAKGDVAGRVKLYAPRLQQLPAEAGANADLLPTGLPVGSPADLAFCLPPTLANPT